MRRAITKPLTAMTAADLVTLNVSGATNFTTTIGATATKLATVNAAANTGTVVISAAAATSAVTMTGSATAASTLTGGTGADVITGGSAADNLTGGANADTISGGAGADTIVGGTGSDNLTGGEGADTITGGANNDTISLTETIATTDVVVYEATGAGNGADAVSGFRTGALASGGDQLDFQAFLTTTTNALVANTSNPAATALVANNIYTLVDVVDGQDISTAAGLKAALETGGEYVNLNVADGAAGVKYIFLTAASTTATTFNVFMVSGTDDDGTAGVTDNFTVSLVGTVSANDGIGTLIADNFV